MYALGIATVVEVRSDPSHHVLDGTGCLGRVGGKDLRLKHLRISLAGR